MTSTRIIILYHHPVSSSRIIIPYHHLISSSRIISYHHPVSSSHIIIPYHHLISSISHIIIPYHHPVSSSRIIIPYHHPVSSSHIIVAPSTKPSSLIRVTLPRSYLSSSLSVILFFCLGHGVMTDVIGTSGVEDTKLPACVAPFTELVDVEMRDTALEAIYLMCTSINRLIFKFARTPHCIRYLKRIAESPAPWEKLKTDLNVPQKAIALLVLMIVSSSIK